MPPVPEGMEQGLCPARAAGRGGRAAYSTIVERTGNWILRTQRETCRPSVVRRRQASTLEDTEGARRADCDREESDRGGQDTAAHSAGQPGEEARSSAGVSVDRSVSRAGVQPATLCTESLGLELQQGVGCSLTC
jgi:hypothetical protein